jgi:hypothetical protein
VVRRAREELGIPVQDHRKQASTHKGIDWDKQPLGQMSDQDLAKRLGVFFTAVHKQRRKRGIPSFAEQNDLPQTWVISWGASPLGQMADAALAKQLGVGAGTVRKHRIRLGIPAFDPTLQGRNGMVTGQPKRASTSGKEA